MNPDGSFADMPPGDMPAGWTPPPMPDGWTPPGADMPPMEWNGAEEGRDMLGQIQDGIANLAENIRMPEEDQSFSLDGVGTF